MVLMKVIGGNFDPMAKVPLETYVDKDAPVILGLDLKSRAQMAFERWKRGSCVYLCWVCQDGTQTFDCSVALSKHLSKAHGMGVSEHRCLYGSPRVVTDRIVCKLCKDKRRVVYDGRHLARHFRQEHEGTTLMEYFLYYVYSEVSEGMNPLSEREKVLKRWSENDNDGRELEDTEESEITKEAGLDKSYFTDKSSLDNPVKDADSRTALSLEETGLNEAGLNETASPRAPTNTTDLSFQNGDTETREVANFCKFRCKICDYEANGKSVMFTHLYGKHQRKRSNKSLSGCLYQRIKTSWHLCHVCDKRILCDNRVIFSHARKAHRLSASQYASLAGKEENMPERLNAKSMNIEQIVEDEVAEEASLKDGLENDHGTNSFKEAHQVETVSKVNLDSDASLNEDNIFYLGKTRRRLNLSFSEEIAKPGADRDALLEKSTDEEPSSKRVRKTRVSSSHNPASEPDGLSSPKDKRVRRTRVSSPDNHATEPDKSSSLEESRDVEQEAKEVRNASLSLLDHDYSKSDRITLPNDSTGVEDAITGGDAATTEIANLCRFSCSHCNFEVNGQQKMIAHSKSKHYKKHLEATRGSRTYKRIKTAWHLCTLCGDKILCDLVPITNHLRSRHELLLSDYMSLTGKENTERPKRVPKKKIKALSKKVKRRPLEQVSKDKNSLEAELPDLEESWSLKVADLCQYKCKICDLEGNQRNLMFRHSKASHPREHAKSTGTLDNCTFLRTKITWHRCRVCDKRLACDRLGIIKHINKMHGLKMADYVVDGEAARMNYKSQNCKDGNTLDQSSSNSNTVQGQHKGDIATGEMEANRCQEAELPHEAGETTTTQVADLCRYKCTFCDFENNSKKSMMVHAATHPHELAKTKDGTKRGKCIYKRIKTIWHYCVVCNKRIPCDKYAIYGHANKVHGLKASTYDTKVVAGETQRNEEVVSAKLENLCQYTCKMCSHKAKTLNYMKLHARIKHPRKYKRNSKKSCIYRRSKTVWHICSLCQKKIPCDRGAIALHLNSAHKIKLACYEDMQSGNKDHNEIFHDPINETEVIDNIAGIYVGDNSDRYVNETEVNDKETEGIDEDHSSHRFHETEAVCSATEENGDDHSDHHINESELFDNEAEENSDESNQHANETDVIGTETEGNGDNISNQQVNVAEENKDETEVNDNNLPTQEESPLRPTSQNHCQEGNNAEESEDGTTTKVANLCHFTCRLCSHEAQSLGLIKFHAKFVHAEETKSNPKSCTYERTKTVWHICMLCQEKVPCDRNAISTHTTQVHKLLLHDYTAKMSENNGDSSLPRIESYQSVK